MTSPPAPTTYEIRVSGHLGDQWADRWTDWLGDVSIRRCDDGTSVIVARVTDQAQLHGLLAGLRDLNATLVEVRRRGR